MPFHVGPNGQPTSPIVVGIVNCTPDSFYDGGSHASLIGHAKQLLDEGADWIDVGGESTRPGADAVSPDAEWQRVRPVIEACATETVVCVDTSKADVAIRAADAGARVLNDVTGLRDDAMAAASQRFNLTVVMHMRGTPRTMQALNKYTDLVSEIRDSLLRSASRARSDMVAIDPGIGFAKDATQSLTLLAHLSHLIESGFPVYLGASRKSFVGHVLRLPDPNERLYGSLAAVAAAWARGVRIFRVHDVLATRQLVDMLAAIDRANAVAPEQKTP